MRRIPLICCFLWLILLFSCCRAQTPPDNGAKAAILIERHSGRVLYEKNADQRLPMASTTKVMTCLLALENCALDDMVTVGPNASGVPGTSIYLSVGERLSMRDLLYGLMLRSGNDAAVAVAEYVSGSVKDFADLMNARAEEIGADAYFITPNGLDAAGHAASARAMALITREAMRNEAFREIVSTQKKNIPWPSNEYARALTNKNRLLREYEGATGVKTGFTSKAGRCLIFSAERNDLSLIGVLLNDGAWFDDAENLLTWGFSEYQSVTPLQKGESARRVAVAGGWPGEMDVVAKDALFIPLAAGEEWTIAYEIPPLNAPVRAGDLVGIAIGYVGAEPVAKTDLLAAESAARVDFSVCVKRVFGNWPIERIFVGE